MSAFSHSVRVLGLHRNLATTCYNCVP